MLESVRGIRARCTDAPTYLDPRRSGNVQESEFQPLREAPQLPVDLIQEGIFNAFAGETVTIQPGTYNETVHFLGKDVIVTGTDPTNPTTVANTIIDNGPYISNVFFFGTEPDTAKLAGLSIANGSPLPMLYSYPGIKGNGTLAIIGRDFIVNSFVAYSAI